jgi:hypothetical protein
LLQIQGSEKWLLNFARNANNLTPVASAIGIWIKDDWRSWTAEATAFGVVVRIEQVSTGEIQAPYCFEVDEANGWN